MSLLQTQGAPGAPTANATQGTSIPSTLAMIAAMDAATKPNTTSIVNPHRDARAIIRLIQCSQCSLPLRMPLTLPCGNSLCRTCLPELRIRTGVTYPMTANRQEGFTCPFKDCGKEHSLGDCSQDVTLAKVMDRLSVEVAHARPLTSNTPTLLDERPRWRNVVDSSKDLRYPASRILNGGRLVATYTMAEIGELKYDSEVAYHTMSPTGDNYDDLDITMLAHLKEATKAELDCQVCYALMLDPLTTNCGHTFCRKCVARVLDHSTMCPVCRRDLLMPPGVRHVPGNKTLFKLLNSLCPDLVAARAEAAAQEEVPMLGGKNVPLFVCTLAYPSMPTFLHIFEPRYRLMIRRAIENGDGQFGMLMYNRGAVPQGSLGSVQFLQYGTLVRINSIEYTPDGRSLIETRGVSRFRVKDWGMLDGYVVGNIERVDDISLAEEEHVEATETTGPAPIPHDLISQLDYMSTQELLKIGTDFIARMQSMSASWLSEGVLASYGPPPDDPALFPYWLASILPIEEEEKYKLIPTTSVRERLKMTARWVRGLEARNCPPSRDDIESSDSDEEENVSTSDEDPDAETTNNVQE